MLILTRKAGERIFIMDSDMNAVEICITVVKTRGEQISLGIDADKSYTILREEVFLRSAQGDQGVEYQDDCQE
jgi:carbon storage regulator CsrA